MMQNNIDKILLILFIKGEMVIKFMEIYMELIN